MKIAKQAWRFVFVGAAVDAGAAALIAFGAAKGNMAAVALGALGSFLATGFMAFCLYFFRDPERPLPADDKKIYSPGDGRVMSVAQERGDGTTTLRIFLSVFDVHLQRVPTSGTVTEVRYQPGSFRAAMIDEAKLNERSVMTIERPDKKRLVVEQIAGYVARRIETWPKAGQLVKAGERYGIIYFGSQAAVHFPPGSRCTVKAGDRVAGCLSVIGEWE